QSPAPDATAVSVNTTVTATFSEAIQSGTILFVLNDAAGNGVGATGTYSGAPMTATLAPPSPLAAGTTDTATVSGAKDAAGNVMAPVSWSFTTAPAAAGGTWTQTTAADFGAGSSNGTNITSTSDGEVQLSRALDDDFVATNLGSAWTVQSW